MLNKIKEKKLIKTVSNTDELGIFMYEVTQDKCVLNFGDVMVDFARVLENCKYKKRYLWAVRTSGSQIAIGGEVNSCYARLAEAKRNIKEYIFEGNIHSEKWNIYEITRMEAKK
jgi:hypothetical protein